MATNDFINGLYPKQKKTRNPTRFRALSLQTAKVNARQSMRVEHLPPRRTPAMQQVLRPHAPFRNDKRALSMRAEYSRQGAHLPCSRCCVRTLHSATINTSKTMRAEYSRQGAHLPCRCCVRTLQTAMINASKTMRVEPLQPRRTPAMQVLRPHAPFHNDKR